MAAAPRRRRLAGQRRRVEDEGEDDVDILDDDSLTEGSLVSDDHDAANDSDTSNVDDASPTADGRKTATNGITRAGRGKNSEDSKKAVKPVMTDTEIMLNGLSLTDSAAPVEEINFDDLHQESPIKTAAPIVVSSASASTVKLTPNTSVEAPFERRRREHDEYRRKRDEDPAFVPNRGAFFMHDHRGAGPSANGFRPFNRGGGRGGRGRGGFAGHLAFAPHAHINNTADPTTSAPWSHDMHETVVKENLPMQSPRHMQYVAHNEGPANGNGVIPRRLASTEPINRTLSTEKHIGNAQVRVFFPPLKQPTIITGLAVKQYTKLPDHRPPLRRDKPVRISLPHNPPRYVYPASDRSFIFIPRAMRPNQQQRVRGKPRSVFGSVGGFSRRTSIYGGGSYYGSVYSPSVAMSRRSSINFDMGRDHVLSPTGSTMSRPPLPIDTGRPPVVRLPPSAPSFEQQTVPQGQAPYASNVGPTATSYNGEQPMQGAEASITDLPQPQTHPLPQKPNFQESRSAQLPMHQPRPQKTVSVETIESPTLSGNTPQSFQQAFHQQVPVQVSNVPQDTHHRRPSHPPHASTGTPLSQIPERAIHAAPFQPNAYPQQNYYGAPQPYNMMPPQQGYYYPPPQQFAGGMPPSATAPAFVPGAQQQQPMGMPNMAHGVPQGEVAQPNGQQGSNPNLITQEVNGTFYFYDASQLPAVNNYPPYGAQPYVPVGMPGMMAPSPDGFYYPQTAPGMMYYSQ